MNTQAAWPLRLVTADMALSALGDAEGWVRETTQERAWLGLVTLTTQIGPPLIASVWLVWRWPMGTRKARHALVGVTMTTDDTGQRQLSPVCLVDRRVLASELTPMHEHPHTRAHPDVLDAVSHAGPADDVVPLIQAAWQAAAKPA